MEIRRNLMISKKIQKALNEQLRYEMESANLYLSMAAYFHAQGLDGMASWMVAQVAEENGHAMRFFDHLRDRNGRIMISALGQPKTEWASPLEAWQEAYKHEQFITGRIHGLVKLAVQEADYAANAMLQWFVAEQVEEEANTSKIADMLQRIGPSGSGLVMLDRQLGKRKGE
jgi:ferritin